MLIKTSELSLDVLHKDVRDPYLGALSCAVPLSSGAPRAGVLCSRWFPGPLLGGAVVVEVPAVRVLVGLPVAQDVDWGAGGDRGLGGLADLQLLEVSVDGRLRASLA